MALSLSFSLGIHRTGPPIPQGFPPGVIVTSTMSALHTSLIRRRKLEKRTWWCLCLQDQFLDIEGSGKRRLNPEDHDVDMLEMDDFNGFDEMTDGEDEDRDRCIRQMQAKTFIEKVQLYRWATQTSSKAHRGQDEIFHSAPFFHRSESPLANNVVEPLQAVTTSPDPSPCYAYAISNTTSEDLETEQDCPTPQDHHFSIGMSIDPTATQKYVDDVALLDKTAGADVKFGYGVDGEYDDYLEYL